MFPEFQAEISARQSADPHFESMVRKHTDLNQRIDDMEAGRAAGSPLDIEKLKKEKLHLKDRIYALLRNGPH
jgi:uncharacterized protein YdcH (DUF465 family)